jgi:hypothetical protein
MKAFHSGGFDEMNKPLEGVKAARDIEHACLTGA